ncbi:MAG: XRE family transcriptional regulator [Pseudomonadota bacterium]
MQLNEANAIAQFLRVPSAEVFRHVGVSEVESDEPCILLAAAVNEDGQVEILKEARSLPQRVIARSQVALKMHVGLDIVAAQIRASTGTLAMLDDAVILFRRTGIVEETAIGTLAICRSYDGEQILCRVEQARKTGEARVILASGKISELILHTATPVLAIIP